MNLLASMAGSLILLSCASAAAADQSQICFHRDEDNGSINILSSRVVLTKASRRLVRHDISLIGGENKCIVVEPGRWSVQARSTRPYDPSDRDSNRCRSTRLTVFARGGEKVSVDIAPRNRGPA